MSTIVAPKGMLRVAYMLCPGMFFEKKKLFQKDNIEEGKHYIKSLFEKCKALCCIAYKPVLIDDEGNVIEPEE